MHDILNRELPKRIFQDKRLRRTSRLVYLGMRTVPKTHVAGYARALHMSYQTVRVAIKELRDNDWVYGYRNPGATYETIVPWMPYDIEVEVAHMVERKVDTAKNWGETIFKMNLDLIVDVDDFLDNHRFKWAVSALGSGAYEIDRMYETAQVAIEFQGRQHFQVVYFRDGKSDLVAQQARDRAKALACERQRIKLVEIADVELSYETLVRKLTGVLPLIQPLKDRPLFLTLQKLCDAQVNNAKERSTG